MNDENGPLATPNVIDYECVVLDASNALYRNILGPDGEDIPLISPESLQLLITEIESLGWPVHAAMKKATHHYALTKGDLNEKSKALLLSLINSLKVSLVDMVDDDPFIIKAAISRNGWIVSNDKFGKWREEHPGLAIEISNRRRGFQWVGDRPVISGLPIRVVLEEESGVSEIQVTNSTGSKDDFKGQRVLASEAVLSYIASGEKMPLPNVHGELGVMLLDLPRGQQGVWPKGWVSDLNELLGYPEGTKLKALLTNLFEDRISFDQHRVWIK